MPHEAQGCLATRPAGPGGHSDAWQAEALRMALILFQREKREKLGIAHKRFMAG
jgi:hypothetical protein